MSSNKQPTEYDTFDQQKESFSDVVKTFIPNYTNLTSIDTIEVNSYHGALTIIFALSWEQNQYNALIKEKLQSFDKRKQLHQCLDIASRLCLRSAFQQMHPQFKIINSFRLKFKDQELKNILKLNQQFYIIVAKFDELKDKKDRLVEQQIFGNKNAQKVLFVILNADKRQGYTYLIHCTNQEEFERSEKLHEALKKSNTIQQKKSLIQSDKKNRQSDISVKQNKQTKTNISSRSSSQINIRDSNQSQDSKQSISMSHQSSKSNKQKNKSKSKQQASPIVQKAQKQIQQEKKSLNLHQPFSGNCQDCQQFKTIDDKSKLCWQCFDKKGKTDYMDIIWYLFFVVFVIFLFLLNYYHALQNKYVSKQNNDLLNSISNSVYNSLFNSNENHNV